MFTTEHFIWIGLCAIFIAVMTVVSVKFKFSFRTSAFIMAGIAFASETSKIISDMRFVDESDISRGMVLSPKSLPFHLCSLLIFVFFYLPFAKNEKLKKFLTSLFVPVGLIGAALAILMATSGTDFKTPDAYQCFVYHAGMIWFALYLFVTKQVDLGVRAWGKNLVSLFGVSVFEIWINSALSVYNTNFLYIVRPPVEGLPILNLDHGWYVYYLSLAACCFVGVTVVHLPFMIKEIRSKAKAKKETRA